jgi:hypothetical protein
MKNIILSLALLATVSTVSLAGVEKKAKVKKAKAKIECPVRPGCCEKAAPSCCMKKATI